MSWWPHLELYRGGRAMAGVAAAIPVLPWSEDTSLIDLLTSLEAEGKSLNSLATSLTPGSHQVSSGIDIQTLSIRGINRYGTILHFLWLLNDVMHFKGWDILVFNQKCCKICIEINVEEWILKKRGYESKNSCSAQ